MSGKEAGAQRMVAPIGEKKVHTLTTKYENKWPDVEKHRACVFSMSLVKCGAIRRRVAATYRLT